MFGDINLTLPRPKPQKKSKRAQDHLAVTEDGDSVKISSDTPHLVSLGSGRLSTAITVYPLHNVRTTIGSPESIIRHDITIRGTGVDPDHCYIENSNNFIVLYPIAQMCAIDGHLVDHPVPLEQGCMICLGRSNFFRYNNPQEAKQLKSGIIETRILVDPSCVWQSLENDPKYMKMITSEDLSAQHRNSTNNCSSSSVTLTSKKKILDVKRRSGGRISTDKIMDDSNHSSNSYLPLVSPTIIDGKIYNGEKIFTKDTATTRVSANFVQNSSISTDSFPRRRSTSSVSSHKSSSSASSHDSSRSNSDNIPQQENNSDVSFEEFLNTFDKSACNDGLILGSTKSGSPRSPKGDGCIDTNYNNSNVIVNGHCSPYTDPLNQQEIYVPDNRTSTEDHTSSDQSQSGVKLARDANDSEKQELDEVLSLLAEYDKRTKSPDNSKNFKNNLSSPNFTMKSSIPDNSIFNSPIKKQKDSQLSPSIDISHDIKSHPISPHVLFISPRNNHVQISVTAETDSTDAGQPSKFSPSHSGYENSLCDKSGYILASDFKIDGRNSIKTNGSLNMIASPVNQRKEVSTFQFSLRRQGSTSSNSDEEIGTSEDTGTIKRRPLKTVIENFASTPESSPVKSPNVTISREITNDFISVSPTNNDMLMLNNCDSPKALESSKLIQVKQSRDNVIHDSSEDPWDEIIKTSQNACELLNKSNMDIKSDVYLDKSPSYAIVNDGLNRDINIQFAELKNCSDISHASLENTRDVNKPSSNQSVPIEEEITSDSGFSQETSSSLNSKDSDVVMSQNNSPEACHSPDDAVPITTSPVTRDIKHRTKKKRNVSEELNQLKKLKIELVGRVSELKNQILDLDKQENETMRNLELERALLESEHQTEITKLQEDQTRIDRLKSRQSELIRLALEHKEKELEVINNEQSQLKGFESKHNETGELLKLCNGDDNGDLQDRYRREQEVLENQRRFFEDMEFRYLESQSKIEEEKEQINQKLIQEQNSLLSRYKQREERLKQIDKQQKDMLHQAKGEIDYMDHNKRTLINRFKIEKNKLSETENKISQLLQLEDIPFIDEESKDKSVIEDDDSEKKADLITPLPPTPSSLNKLFLFEKYGNEIIEEHRRRLDELKRKAADEVRVEWERRKAREADSKTYYFTESEESSTGSFESHSDKEASISSADDHFEKLADMERMLAEAQSEKLRIINDQVKLREAEMMALQEERKRREALEHKLEQETMLREELVQQEVRLREKQKQQSRPLTRYLPVRDHNIDLKAHIESAGHHLDDCTSVQVTSTCCRGYLHKMGSKFKTWSRRWFVFDRMKHGFFYFGDKNETKARGGIPFKSIEEVYVDHLHQGLRSGSTSKLIFCVKTFNRTYYLMAASPEAMRIWIDVIFTGAEGYRQYLGFNVD